MIRQITITTTANVLFTRCLYNRRLTGTRNNLITFPRILEQGLPSELKYNPCTIALACDCRARYCLGILPSSVFSTDASDEQLQR